MSVFQSVASPILPDDYTQHFSIDQAAAQITRDDDSWSTTLGQAYTVTVAFRVHDATYDNSGVSGFHEFSQAQIDAASLSMQGWSDVANISFSRVGTGDTGTAAYSDNAQILFGDYTTGDPNAAAFTYLPRTGPEAGDVWVNSSQDDNKAPALLNYGQMTLTHEIGHSIGLEHPGDYDASDDQEPTYYNNAAYAEDTRQYSVMSYFSETSTGGDYKGNYASAPQLDDIAAAQRLYGANMTTRTGDTVYGFHSTADRPWFSATDASTPLIFSVWDAGGHDTFDFSGYSQNSVIDLQAGTFSSVGGLTDNVSIAEGVVIEDAIGGSGLNHITGNDADNALTGGSDSDWLYGQGGDDKLNGAAGADNLSGGDGNDTLTGSGSVTLDGGAGNDTLIGGSGIDFAMGGAGDDYADFSRSGYAISYGEGQSLETVVGTAYNDTFFLTPSGAGSSAPNSIDAGAGDDAFYYTDCATIINGGAGADTLVVWDGGGQTISLAGMISVENLMGMQGNDTLIGDAGDNLITGNAGADTLVSGGGADTLDGGGYRINGVGGDTASFAIDSAPVTIDLDAGTATSGGAVTTLLHIFGIIGSDFDDDIAALGKHGLLQGGAGDDIFHLAAAPTAAGNGVDGGAGDDAVDLSQAAKALVISLAAGGSSTLISVESVIGSAFSDSLTGAAADNTLIGGAGNDTLAGSAGDDLLAGGQGNDRLDGGAGVDTVTYSDANHGVTVNLAQGTGGGASAGADILVAVENLIGSGFADTLVGGAGANHLAGMDGADFLAWSGGADTLDGGAGIDTASFGSDRHGVQATAAGTVIADATVVLVSIEKLIGTDFNDTLASAVTGETLSGGDGNDTFMASSLGGAFVGGAGFDTLVADANGLVVDLGAGAALSGDAGAAVFTLSGIEAVTGGAGADHVTGDSGNNALSGLGGNDSLSSGTGRDTLDGGVGADTLAGGIGADVLTGGAGANVFVYASLHDSGGKGRIDQITDLNSKDTIDLHLIDANTTLAGDQAFVEVHAFDRHAGELVLAYTASTGTTKLMVDVDGDGTADLTIRLAGDERAFDHFVL